MGSITKREISLLQDFIGEEGEVGEGRVVSGGQDGW